MRVARFEMLHFFNGVVNGKRFIFYNARLSEMVFHILRNVIMARQVNGLIDSAGGFGILWAVKETTTTEGGKMRLIREFTTTQEARDYRHEHGTGGWIFAPDGNGNAVLFPPDMSPSDIMGHPMTRNRTGDIIGAA